jgi:endoglucanase
MRKSIKNVLLKKLLLKKMYTKLLLAGGDTSQGGQPWPVSPPTTPIRQQLQFGMNPLKKCLRCCCFVLAVLCNYTASATDVKEVLPLTKNILVVHFDDGYVIHHTKGQQRVNESVVTNPLNIANALLLAAYSISSTNDASYSSAKNPVDIGRKSKGTEFAWLCESYDNGCINNSPDYVKEHWLYLFLPTAMQSGKTYTLNLSGLAAGTNTFTFIFNETKLHSDAIHVNNIGYSTAAAQKYGYLYHWLGDKGSLDLTAFANQNFRLADSTTGNTVFTGTVQFRKSKSNAETTQPGETPANNFSAADVYEMDFSAFNTPGNYILVVDGIGASFPFRIDDDVFREPYYWTMKGLYQNRSGIELLPQFTDHPRPAPHNPAITPGFASRLKYTTTRYFDLTNGDNAPADKPTLEAGLKGNLTTTYGWYQDAGDWDTYYTHSNVAAHLLFLYEAGRNKFTDNELSIPESGNGIPDILDEATWQLRFYKRLKDEIKAKGWGSGGVGGARVMGDLWGGDERADGTTKGSWEDTDRDWYVSGEDPWVTYKYAALAAQTDYILRSENLTDPSGVDWRKEAVDAYKWAKANTKAGDETERFGERLKNVRMYAAAALYRLTNIRSYHDEFKNSAAEAIGDILNMDFADLVFSAWIYLQMPANRNTDAVLLNKVRAAVNATSEKQLMNGASNRACRWGGDFSFPMLVGQGTTPMVTAGVYGYINNKVSNPARAADNLAALHTTADYFLGANPLNTTWISGVGERHPVGIFKLDWWYSGNTNVIKGVVPYGPWKVQNLGDLGPWNPNWAYAEKNGTARIYPADISNWPGHERWFDQRSSPLTCEFTIHQNTVVAAFVYGFLTKDKVTKTIVAVPAFTDSSVVVSPATKLKVYPNPVKNSLLVEWPPNTAINFITIHSSSGKLVFIKERIPSTQNKLSINSNQFNAGLYIATVRTVTDEVLTTKLIIGR